MKEKIEFPNGFTNWIETYYLVVETITDSLHLSGNKAYVIQESNGLGGLWDLAKELTDKFELQYKGKEWDGDYFDTIDEFLDKELK